MVARISRTAAMVMSGVEEGEAGHRLAFPGRRRHYPGPRPVAGRPLGTNWTPVALLFLGMAVVSVVCVLLHRAPEESEGAELTATPTLMEA